MADSDIIPSGGAIAGDIRERLDSCGFKGAAACAGQRLIHMLAGEPDASGRAGMASDGAGRRQFACQGLPRNRRS